MNEKGYPHFYTAYDFSEHIFHLQLNFPSFFLFISQLTFCAYSWLNMNFFLSKFHCKCLISDRMQRLLFSFQLWLFMSRKSNIKKEKSLTFTWSLAKSSDLYILLKLYYRFTPMINLVRWLIYSQDIYIFIASKWVSSRFLEIRIRTFYIVDVFIHWLNFEELMAILCG